MPFCRAFAFKSAGLGTLAKGNAQHRLSPDFPSALTTLMLACPRPGQPPAAFTRRCRPRASLAHNGRTEPARPGDGTMQVDALRTIEPNNAPSLAPDDRPIDLVHLARTTLGDRSLEREVLQLFDRQSALLIARLHSAGPDGVAMITHTMEGSARGIGAWRVARAAE